jgi:hypothetical protein
MRFLHSRRERERTAGLRRIVLRLRLRRLRLQHLHPVNVE